MSRKTDAVARAHEGFDRRTLLKAGAWAAPVIVLATAAPAAAAGSGPDPAPPVCVDPSIGAASWSVASGSLGVETGATGWTPVGGSAGSPTTPGPEFSNRSAYYADAIGWAQLSGQSSLPGFVSVNNRSGVGASSTVVAEYRFPVQAGFTYTIPVSVRATSRWLAVQLLDVDLIGAGTVVNPVGGSGTTAVKVGFGAQYTPWAFPAYSELAAADPGASAATGTYAAQFLSAADGDLVVRYTFTLTDMYTSWSNEKQNNADMWVTQPVPACPIA